MKAQGLLTLKSGADIKGCACEGQGKEVTLTRQAARQIGYVFAHMLADRLETTADRLVIAVGHDARQNADMLSQALIHGLTDADADVLDAGMTITPAMFWAAGQGGADGAVMVTASHCAWYENGFKLIARNGAFSEEETEKLLRTAQETQPVMRLVQPCDMTGRYLEQLRRMIEQRLDTDVQCPLLGLHVVVDAGGGVGGFFAGFLEEMGCEVTGSTDLEPNEHQPECTRPFDRPQTLEKLSEIVTGHTADMGIALDADGGRAAIVDERGRIISGNRLIALICAVLLEEEPGATIVTDSETSSGLQRFITEWGGVHYRFKRGYQNVIREAMRLNEEGINCPLAIETSGHAAFRENHFLDDGIYLATRLLCETLIRKRDGQKISDLIDELSEPIESEEIRLQILAEDTRKAAQSLIETVLSHTLDNTQWHLAGDNREGVRILFDLEGGVENAWFQIRLSVHDPVLAISAQSDVPGGVKYILSQLYDLIREEQMVDLEPLKRAIGKE